MSTQWPESLKSWVTLCLTQMTEANRDEAQKELKEIIRLSVADQSIWTRDWSKVKLTSLEPKTFQKRKIIETTPQQTKKPKKAALATSVVQNENDERLRQRARRFEREHEIERQKQAGLRTASHEYSRHVNHQQMDYTSTTINSNVASTSKMSKSRRKYLNSTAGYNEEEDNKNGDGMNWDRYSIVGTSEALFKPYLRLTSEPDPRDVRPYRVLTKTLDELKLRWKNEQNYSWICDQFKSLRQDLTVQRIKNEFTVSVYEIHARMALESADLVEYNQCQSALRHLYELGIPGKSEEFLAYRILYLLHIRNRGDLNRLISTLTPQVKTLPAVAHALRVQRAMATGNYHTFFSLFLSAPNMGAYLMDHFLERERLGTLCVMTKAYITLPLSHIVRELAFENVNEAHTFLSTNGAAFYSPNAKNQAPNSTKDAQLDCKAAFPQLSRVYEEKTRRVALKGAI